MSMSYKRERRKNVRPEEIGDFPPDVVTFPHNVRDGLYSRDRAGAAGLQIYIWEADCCGIFRFRSVQGRWTEVPRQLN